MASAWAVQKDTFHAASAMAASDSPAPPSTSAAPAQLSEAAAARQQALGRLKDRLKGQRPVPEPSAHQQRAQAGPGGAAAPLLPPRPLLQPYPPQVPQFKDLKPQLPTHQQPAGATTAAAPPSSSSSGPPPTASAIDEFVRRAEALRQSLAEAASSSAVSGSAGQLRPSSPGGGPLSLLQYISEPGVADDLVRESLFHRRGGQQYGGQYGTAAAWYGPRGPGDEASEGYETDYDSEGSVVEGEEDGGRDGRGPAAGGYDEGEEDEDEAAAWSEKKLLDQLFFPSEAAASAGGEPVTGRQAVGLPRSGTEPLPVHTSPGGGRQSPKPSPPRAGVNEVSSPASSASSSPVLQVTVAGLRVPAHHTDLSIVVKSPALSALSQRQHWSIPGGATGGGSTEAALLSLSLPAHAGMPLPCPLMLEVWDKRSVLVGVAQLSLLPAAGADLTLGTLLHASCSGSVSLRNPLLSASEEAQLLAECSVAVEALLLLPPSTPHLQEGPAPGSPLSPLVGEAGTQQQPGDPSDSPPMFRHTFRVTVCGAQGMPDAAALASEGRPVPCARFMRYLYPGVCTVGSDRPGLSGSALLSMLLPYGSPPQLPCFPALPLLSQATPDPSSPRTFPAAPALSSPPPLFPRSPSSPRRLRAPLH